MNDLRILGRLTNAPEMKKSAQGRDYCWFTVAVPRRNNREEADFIRCVAFDKLAQAIYQHCGKGRQVLCSGRLQVSTSIDEDTKRIRYHHTVVVSSTHFLHDPNRHAQKPYILEITKNAPVSGAFLCSMKDIRVSGIALRNAVSALRRSSHACGRVSPYRLGQPVKATGYS